MKEGFRIYDTDTHIDPGADVLEKYVDPSFRPRLDDLAPYRRAIKSRCVEGGVRHTSSFARKAYERTLGEAEPRPGSADGRVWRGERRPSPGVVDDRSDNRVLDMDTEGSDVHFLVPSVWTSVVGLPDVSLEIGLIRAYHRFMREFCLPFKGPIVASTRDVDEAVREIHEWGRSKWAVAVQPLLDNDRPVDHPDLEPIWRAAEEHDLAIVHHSFTWSPPYFTTRTCGTMSIWRGCARIPGERCGSWPAFSPAEYWTATRACGSAFSNAASAGCRSGSGAWTSKSATSAAPPSSSTCPASISPPVGCSAILRRMSTSRCSTWSPVRSATEC